MPMMFMQTSKVLYQGKGKGKGDDETRSGDEQVRIHIHCLYVFCIADLIFIAFSVRLLFTIREKDLVDEMEGAGRRRVADPSRGCLKREEEREREGEGDISD